MTGRFLSKRRNLVVMFWSIALLINGFHAWVARHSTEMDGVSYLDMGEAYLAGDWETAINAYWSPLYSWLLAGALWLVEPGPYNEFAVARGVNFLVFIACLFAFHFLLMQLVGAARDERNPAEIAEGLPEWAWLAVGYSIFIWCSMTSVNVVRVTPDLCVAAFVFLAGGLLVRLNRGAGGRSAAVLLGLVLGAAYLTKAVMFPVGLVFLVACLITPDGWRNARPRTALAALVFLVVAAPMIGALSMRKGRLTIGDTGKLNYAWMVNRVSQTHWIGDPPSSGQPVHGIDRIFESPDVFEFGTPVGGTYPIWYDPSYWYEGVQLRFNWSDQLRVLETSLKAYFRVFAPLLPLMIGLATLYWIRRDRHGVWSDLVRQSALVLAPMTALILYTLVHVEGRYVASFGVLLCLAGLDSVRLPDSRRSKRAIAAVVGLAVASLSFQVAAATRNIVSRSETYIDRATYDVAAGLTELGIRPGDRVAYFGVWSPSWARTVRVRIVAEMLWWNDEDKQFWALDAAAKRELFAAVARSGASMIVVQYGPEAALRQGWRRVGETQYMVYLLR